MDATTGSLGQGVSIAAGMALSHRLAGCRNRVFSLLGDGELNEGQCWEAFQFIAHHNLNNLTLFIDYNKQQLDGALDEVIQPFDLAAKFRAFGFEVQTIKGDDIAALLAAVAPARGGEQRPLAIVLDSIKAAGRGLSGKPVELSPPAPDAGRAAGNRKAIAELEAAHV